VKHCSFFGLFSFFFFFFFFLLVNPVWKVMSSWRLKVDGAEKELKELSCFAILSYLKG